MGTWLGHTKIGVVLFLHTSIRRARRQASQVQYLSWRPPTMQRRLWRRAHYGSVHKSAMLFRRGFERPASSGRQHMTVSHMLDTGTPCHHAVAELQLTPSS